MRKSFSAMRKKLSFDLMVVVWLVLSVAAAGQAPAGDLRLVTAAQNKEVDTIRALLKAGVDVNARRPDGVTALHWAAHWGDVVTADVLLRAGADVNAGEGRGVTPLILACEHANEAMVARLLAAGGNPVTPQANGVTPLMMAARTGNVGVIKKLLGTGADAKAVIPATRQTALMWATAEGHHEAMRVLIAAGSDVRMPSSVGFTPFMFAARNGDIQAAKILMAAGASVNDVGSDGTHPLPLAIVSGRADFAHFLLEHGADPNGRIHGVSALHAAVGRVDDWIRDWLRVRRLTIYTGRTAGIDASRRLPLVKMLLAAGADPNGRITTDSVIAGFGISGRYGARDPHQTGIGSIKGATPLWIAAFNAGRTRLSGDPSQLVGVLLDAGADPGLRTDDGTTTLMVAAGLGTTSKRPEQERGPKSAISEAVVKMLVAAGNDVNAVNEADFTALHGAAFRGSNEIIQYLVEHGANINAQDFRGRTAYSIALGPTQQRTFSQSWPETAELLRQLGADTALGVDRMAVTNPEKR